jgi:signal transduction histidine kinase
MINNFSVRIKIIIGQVMLVSVVVVFIYNYYPAQQERAASLAIDSRIQSVSNIFSIGVGIGMGETDFVAVSEALAWAKADTSLVYISVVNDRSEKITAFHTLTTVPAEITQLVEKKKVEIDGVIYYKTSIVYQDQHFGKLIIGYSLSQTREMLRNLKLTTLYFCLALFASGLILSVIIGNMISKNIRKLDSTVQSISNGSEHARVKVTGKDEIGKLGNAFNHMLDRLEQSRNELIKYSEQLKKQNDELNQFSYVVSHDLKAPLRAIFKLSEWIEEDIGTNISTDTKKNMHILRGRVFRLEALINGLLQYSKIGRMKASTERVDVRLMLEETIDLLNPPAHIKINIINAMPVLDTKKSQLQQVFINLLSNAIKYNDKQQGLVDISVSEIAGYYKFIVEDNGMGIPPQYHEKVFEIFQTLESRDKIEGTGVGLSIIKKSVEDMGGIIILESEASEGARFIFTWPKAA